MSGKTGKVKNWITKHRTVLITAAGVVTGVTLFVVAGGAITKAMENSERKLLEVVENRLKFTKDGDFVDVVVRKFSDDFTETDVVKRWTKLNGETLYLGKVNQVYDLSEEQMIGKQIDKLYRSIAGAIYKFTKN